MHADRRPWHERSRPSLLAIAAVCWAATASCTNQVVVGDEAPANDAGLLDIALPEGSVLCGDAACEGRVYPFAIGGPTIQLPGCCIDTPLESSRCGVDYEGACIELHQPGVVSADCPSVAQSPGCCRPDGQCGIMTPDDLGLGCVQPFPKPTLPGSQDGGGSQCTYRP